MAESSSPNPASRPFLSAPDPSRYFPATTAEEARKRLTRSIGRGEGPGILIGAIGTGKTMLLEVLALQFASQMTVVSLAGSQICTRRALLQMVLYQLDLPYRGLDEGELRLSLRSFLQPQGGSPQKILLLVDEAESLPPRLLEELRALTNQTAQGSSLVSLVLFGSTSLEEQFADAKLETFSQRISARCYLEPLGREETFHYIRSQVASVGHDPEELFAADGLEAMYAATDGVPRLINQLGDQLVWMANETGYHPLDGQIVQQAWSELQQLPAPWNMPTAEPTGNVAGSDTGSDTGSNTGSNTGSVVEFGELACIDNASNPLVLEAADVGEAVIEEVSIDQANLVEADELPASIPMTAAWQSNAHVPQSPDATEQLLDHSGEEFAEFEPFAPAAPVVASARDPFQEQFDSEVAIADRYVNVEEILLATAQRVTNFSDVGFAKQLDRCELSPVATASLKLGPETVPEIQSSSEPTAPEPVGELLVVENGDFPEPEIVSGEQFRRLFSSLESGSALSQLG